jgi:hypothetical protein
VRACVKGWRRSPCGCAQTAAAAAESGLGRRSIHPSHVWIGKGREGYAGGKEGLEEKRDDCTDCGILQPVGGTHSLQSSALELFWFPARVCCCSGKEREGTKQASKLSPPTPANTTQACLLHQSLPLTFCAHWPAAHCELISKRRRPTLASMLQRCARS